jgi:DCN1-like protein 1/2
MPTQKEKIKAFVAFTSSTQALATKFLKEFNWNLDQAVDSYFSRVPKQITNSKIEKIFDEYCDANDKNVILVNGTEKLCADLGVDPNDVLMLVLSWHLESESMCEFSRPGWIKGWTNLGAQTFDQMKSCLDNLKNELSDPAIFQQVYVWTFGWAKSLDTQQKSLPLDTAIAFWRLILPIKKYKHLDLWIEYLTEHYKKSINKDVWSLLIDFMDSIGDDFSGYDEGITYILMKIDGAWPTVFDSFVEYARNKLQL